MNTALCNMTCLADATKWVLAIDMRTVIDSLQAYAESVDDGTFSPEPYPHNVEPCEMTDVDDQNRVMLMLALTNCPNTIMYRGTAHLILDAERS